MPYYNGEKWACYSCTKGHRSSKCMHTDRILYKVRKPGRPLNNCPHTLPETIQPGTFVNTSAASMANGKPPKETCNCKSEQVEVAIPKVKHCSCTIAPDASKPPKQKPANGDNQSGVKTGRITKKQHRRKQSIVSNEVQEAAKADVGVASDAKTPSTEAPPRFEAGHDPSLPSNFPSESAHPPEHTNHTYPQDHTLPAGFPQQHMNGLLQRWPPQHNPLANGTMAPQTPLIVQHDNQFHQQLPPTPEAQSTHFQITPQPDPSLYGQMNGLPMQTAEYFGAYPKPDPSQMAIPNGHSTPVIMASFQSTPITSPHPNNMALHQEKIMVPLTHHEYLWIQHARSSGVDFSKLPKFVSEQQTLPLGAAHSSQFAQPQQPPPMSFPAPTTMATPTSTTAPSFPEPSKPDRVKGCCKSKASPAEEVSTGPSSPRCKCGDACRCVPCADHPFNPAMLETIKGDMLHLQSPGEQSTSNATGRGQNADQKNSPSAYDQDGYPDEQSPADSGSNNIMADFNNFVFHNYSYGSGCMEGQGGCMCGEGCTCVGCLTHGGHDGVSLQSLGDSATANTDANGSGNHQQHSQQQTEQQPGHEP